jgi:hypothetical protein
MIHIKYKLDRSDKHGIGLFTDEDLKFGQLIYTASPLLDINITQEKFDSLSDREREEFHWWGFLMKHHNYGMLILMFRIHQSFSRWNSDTR